MTGISRRTMLGGAAAMAAAAAPAIVIDPGAPESVRRAAAELQTHLEKMTGERVPLESAVRPQARGTLIVVGDHPLARAAGIDCSRLPAEGYVVAAHGRAIFLAGADPWNAVASFLEQELGVRWLWPGDLGTVVPKRADVGVSVARREDRPRLASRILRDGLPALRTSPRNIFVPSVAQFDRMIPASANWLRRQRTGGAVQPNFQHAFAGWSGLHADHPGYFAMMPDGSRPLTGNPKLCVSNPAVVELCVREARAYFAAQPDAVCFSVSISDSTFSNHCVCETCEALDDPRGEVYRMDWLVEGKRVRRPHVSLTDRHVHFWNAVAERIEREFPGKYAGAHAYGAWRNPPLREKLSPHVLISYVGYSDMYLADASRRRDLDAWKFWSANATATYYRPNIFHIGDAFPAVYLHRLAEDFRFRAGHRLAGVYFDSILHHWASNGLNYYATARLAWNPLLDPDELLEDYCRHGFGPAAAGVRRYFLAVEHRTEWVASHEGSYENDPPAFVKRSPEFYPAAVLASWRDLLNAAESAAKNDVECAARVAWLRLGVEFAQLQSAVYALTQSERDLPAGEEIRRRIRRRDEWLRAHMEDFSVFAPRLYSAIRGDYPKPN